MADTDKEDKYLDYVSRTNPPIRLYNAADPTSLLRVPSTVPDNQAEAEALDRLRHFVGYDPETGEEIYEYRSEEDVFIPLGRTWEYDLSKPGFVTNDYGIPNTVQDSDFFLISQWITRCLSTERFLYAVYPDWFGVELGPIWRGELVGVPALRHINDQVYDALMAHDRITAVENIEVAEDSGTITLSCDVFLDDHDKVMHLSFIGENGEFLIG